MSYHDRKSHIQKRRADSDRRYDIGAALLASPMPRTVEMRQTRIMAMNGLPWDRPRRTRKI